MQKLSRNPVSNTMSQAVEGMLHPFEKALARSWPPADWADVTVVMAVSGGADSTALACAMARLKQGGAGRLWLAHYNHRMRHTAAEADARFVSQLAQQLGIDCEQGTAHRAPSSEAEARQARYRFLADTAARVGARFIVTAHTADDQAETILHRIVRGTGIAGLAGMQRTRSLDPAVLIRPMLEIRRTEVLRYLDWRSQPFCEDATNRQLHYTRNRIRHDLLPRLASDYNPQIVDALLRLGQLAGEAHETLRSSACSLYERAVRQRTPQAIDVDLAVLESVSPYLVRELFVVIWQRQHWPLQSMGFEQWERLAELASATRQVSSSCDLPGGIRAQRSKTRLELMRNR